MRQSFSGQLPHALPSAPDQAAIARFWQDVDPSARPVLERFRTLIEAAAGGSPYLRSLLLHHTDYVAALLDGEPAQALDEVLADAADAAALPAQAEIMQKLRHLKSRAALLVALADLGGIWDVEEVTAALTRFADRCLVSCVQWLLREAHSAGKLRLTDESDPGRGCGYTVLAMGKQGAFELNYSSDIDLIVLYDPETAPLAEGVEPATFFVRMTKRLVALLQDVTSDGYVFRADLRLRPDPRATQVAISIEAAANYYESMGQNWERAAMIKARAAAGDIALGEEFLARLRPYVWRKYLDFAAIADVQSLKRQIHAVKGHAAIAVRGHNIKLGRGGIREIEFFVQTQQLIAGGRNPKLRGRSTLDMLDALAGAQWVSRAAAEELKDAYRVLRKIEHRLQMANDEQTQTIPSDPDAFARFAAFSGFADPAACEDSLRKTLECVQSHYAGLFEDAGELGTESGSLVFTGGEDDPETIATLTRMGFAQASEISATIRGWHFGRYNATRSGRSKELLTELMPRLLTALSRSGNADHAFLAFDRFLAGLPAGVQLFSLLKANPNLLDLIATILGTAPRLAEELSRRPKVLDAVLDPGFFGPLPAAAELERTIQGVMSGSASLDEAMDRARIVGKEQMFRIGVRILSDTLDAAEAGHAFSALAQCLLSHMHDHVRRDIEERFGRIPGGRSAAVALGKLGGGEMTAGSDLDLILVYDHAPEAGPSDGRKALSAAQYFARFTQRLVAAITAATAEGVLYEVDLRLRPSGNMGPVATSLASFRAYHGGQSWTWEKLALTRARVVSGDEGLKQELEAAIASVLADGRCAPSARADVADMRRLMLKEHRPDSVWDIKRARGGLVEVEFIAQMLQVIHAPEHRHILATNTLTALERLTAAGLLDPSDARALREACTLYHRLTQVLRLCVTGAYRPEAAPAGLNRIVASAAGVPGIAGAEALLAETMKEVAAIFDRIVGDPASP